MKLGLFTDAHAATVECTCRTRRPSLSRQKIAEALAAFEGCDAIVCLGDLVDDCGTGAENIAYLHALAELISACGIPFFCLPGNHDCQNFTKDEFFRRSGFARPTTYRLPGGPQLIFLDAAYHSDGSAYSPERVDWTDAYLPTGELERLRAALADADERGAYVFLHQCLDPAVEGRHIVRNAAAAREIIASSGRVRAVFAGHYHPGGQRMIDGIPYYTLPAMVEGETNRYAILEIEHEGETLWLFS